MNENRQPDNSELNLDLETVVTKDGQVHFFIRGKISPDIARLWSAAAAQAGAQIPSPENELLFMIAGSFRRAAAEAEGDPSE